MLAISTAKPTAAAGYRQRGVRDDDPTLLMEFEPEPEPRRREVPAVVPFTLMVSMAATLVGIGAVAIEEWGLGELAIQLTALVFALALLAYSDH